MSQRKTTENDRRGTRDYREDLTNKIIGLVEEGVAPWQKPWNADEAAGILEMADRRARDKEKWRENRFRAVASPSRSHTKFARRG